MSIAAPNRALRRSSSRRMAACKSSARMLWSPTLAITVSFGRLRKMSPMPQIPKVRIRRANRPLTTKDPALERIACSMEASSLCFGGGGRLTRPPADVILAPEIETGPRGRNMAVGTKLVAGNWKMNGLREDGAALARGLAERAIAAGAGGPGCELLICPPASLLTTVWGVLAGSGIALGGQDCHATSKGAYTGDISPEMLADAGCSHVILGHSERRHGHGEGDAAVREKILGAWRAGLVAILCVGETQLQRQAGHAADIVSTQLAGSIPNGATCDNLVVAYEPVWAIGTGLTATL